MKLNLELLLISNTDISIEQPKPVSLYVVNLDL